MNMWSAVLAPAIASMMIASVSTAQLARNTGVDARLVTAAEGSRGILIQRAIAVGNDNAKHRGPPDLDATLGKRAHAWIQALQKQSVVGLQLDPAGELYVVAGQDALAKEQFAARLATPGLSLMDRAYTLSLAVTAFSAKGSDTARMRTARQYLAELDAMPQAVAQHQYNAHAWIGNVYYLEGDGPKVVAHLMHALSLTRKIPFIHRVAPEQVFLELADVLSGQNDGRRIIDSVAKQVLTGFQAPPELVAADSAYYWRGVGNANLFKQMLQFTNYLGRPSPLITAQYWWNTTTPTTPSSTDASATVKRLDDGKVRLIELGSISCMWCLVALWDMDKIHDALPPNAEAWYVTRGYGTWGANPVEPKIEAEKLKDFYLMRRKHRVPFALWIGPREADQDGGTLSQNNPMWELFGIDRGPVFLITDGRGIVRHVSAGASKGLEPQQRALRYVLAEAAQNMTPKSAGR